MAVGAYLSLSLRGREAGWRWALIRGWALINFFCLQDGRLFEVGANSRMGAYSRWALTRGWALIRINTVGQIRLTNLILAMKRVCMTVSCKVVSFRVFPLFFSSHLIQGTCIYRRARSTAPS